MAKTRLFIFYSFFVFSSVQGNNVCTYSRTVTKSRVITYLRSYCLFNNNNYRYYSCSYPSYITATREEYYTTIEHYTDCCAGYKKNQYSDCEPVCTPQCVNSKCTQPNYCECYQGYRKDSETHICTPVCSQTCTNSECSAPEVCKCFEGYKQNDSNSYVCNPVCTKNCVNGICTAPEYCTCLEGYQKDTYDNYSCTPVCSERCVNSDCSAPEICTCHTGYRTDYTNKYSCEPICNKECVNGKCVAPDTCICSDGYKKDDSFDHICTPICIKKCENSVCTAPESCTCFPGYKTNPHNKYICEPVCSKNCGNSNCTAPETCTCFHGYKKHLHYTNICYPVCTDSCENGVCIAPEECKCNEGFTKSQEFTNQCQPYCSNECINANCTLPETCSCWEGYESDSNSSCTPVCSKQCKNGFCSVPETCACFEGYVLHIDDASLCIPFCSNCQNGQCFEYEICSCFHGYDNVEDNSTCSPVCKEECVNGFCSSPNTCSCNDGYKTSSTINNVCSPWCTLKCINGNCAEPERCECLNGYVPSEESPNVCQPFCSSPCINGTCSQPDSCSCYWGFVQDRNDSFKCSLYDEEYGCKTIRVLEPILKYTNESCFRTGDYVLGSFIIEDCPFIHYYVNKYVLQSSDGIYDKLVSFSCILTSGRNKLIGTSVQLECDLLPNKSKTESTTPLSTDEYTTLPSTEGTEDESSTKASLTSDHVMYLLTIDTRDNKIPFTHIPYTYDTVVHQTAEHTKTKHSELDVEDNVFDVLDTSHSVDLNTDQKVTELALATRPNEVRTIGSDVSEEKISITEMNVSKTSHSLVIKVLWFNYIMKNKLTEDSLKISRSQRFTDNSFCLCLSEENRRLCFGKEIKLNLCRCHPHKFQYGGSTSSRSSLTYDCIIAVIVVTTLGTVLIITYRKFKATGKVNITAVYEMK